VWNAWTVNICVQQTDFATRAFERDGKTRCGGAFADTALACCNRNYRLHGQSNLPLRLRWSLVFNNLDRDCLLTEFRLQRLNNFFFKIVFDRVGIAGQSNFDIYV